MESPLIDKFIKANGGQEITKHEGTFSILVWGTAAYAVSALDLDKYFCENFGSLLFLAGDGKGVGFFNLAKYQECTEKALVAYLENRENFSLMNEYASLNQGTEELYKNLSPEVIKSLDDEQLKKNIVDSFHDLVRWQKITLFCEALDDGIVKKYYKNLNGSELELDAFIRNSTAVDFSSLTAIQTEALLGYHDNPRSSQWSFSSYWGTPDILECDEMIDGFIKERGGVDELRAFLEKSKVEATQAAAEAAEFRKGLSGKLLDLYDFTKGSVAIRDVRKVGSFKIITIMSNLVREFFNRHGLPVDYYPYVFQDDFLSDVHLSDEYGELLKKRKAGFLALFGPDGVSVDEVDFNGTRQTIFSIIDGDTASVSEIKGNIGCRGAVKGKVRVILNASEFERFNEGDILVTSMTRPEFVPLMRKAAAVITDEGGITCHAAIVSRELNIPCVIGTKKSTRILKDGDMVEVDADNGMIRILK